jgi:hypothetical protein
VSEKGAATTPKQWYGVTAKKKPNQELLDGTNQKVKAKPPLTLR